LQAFLLALYEQQRQLERAKTHDLLKAKIAKRPDRKELVHRHILEDVIPSNKTNFSNLK